MGDPAALAGCWVVGRQLGKGEIFSRIRFYGIRRLPTGTSFDLSRRFASLGQQPLRATGRDPAECRGDGQGRRLAARIDYDTHASYRFVEKSDAG